MSEDHGQDNARGWLATIEELIERLDKSESSDAEETTETVLQEIHEGPLSVQVRDGWRNPGVPNEDGPDEYEILLSTGGPALRIYGKLGAHCGPESAELQYQDWFTPWTRFPAAEETLLRYAAQFYFGD
jgi:hypothetical protein